MPRFGLDVVLAHPPEFPLMPQIMNQAREQAIQYGVSFDVVDSMEEGCQNADIVYAKSWGPMLTTQDAEYGKTLQDIALEFGVSRQAVQQSIANALKNLKNPVY